VNVMAARHVTGTWLVIVVKMYIIIHYGITLSLVKYLSTESAIAVQFAIRITAVACVRCNESSWPQPGVMQAVFVV
jgi:hypothetical protein